MGSQFAVKEKPYKDCLFQITSEKEQYKCDLYWEKSKVVFFTVYNEESYVAARKSNILCFFSGDVETDSKVILAAIKEK